MALLPKLVDPEMEQGTGGFAHRIATSLVIEGRRLWIAQLQRVREGGRVGMPL